MLPNQGIVSTGFSGKSATIIAASSHAIISQDGKSIEDRCLLVIVIRLGNCRRDIFKREISSIVRTIRGRRGYYIKSAL